MKTKKLKSKYEKYCNEYLKKFQEKQGLREGSVYWESVIGGDILFDIHRFKFLDIVWDINSKQPEGLIFKWDQYFIDSLAIKGNTMNYYEYTTFDGTKK